MFRSFTEAPELTQPIARRIDGIRLAQAIRAEVAQRAATLTASGQRPGLAVLLVGNVAASAVYVRNKVKACEEAGIRSILEHLPEDITQANLLERIAALNQAPDVHGILVQLPLPNHIDAHTVIESIAAAKDIDGFHVANAGALMTGRPGLRPCTPSGVMAMLEHETIALRGAEAVVIGASNIVGKPMALMLQAAGATVTICNSKTRDLTAQTRRADVLIVAAGKPKMILGDMVKPGAVVIDVGIHRQSDGSLCGDVDYESVAHVASAISPVPGGVGPMTIAMLLMNTITATEQQIKNQNRHA